MIHLMAYDYFICEETNEEPATPHSPLYARPNMYEHHKIRNLVRVASVNHKNSNGSQHDLISSSWLFVNQNFSAHYWVEQGCPPYKMTLGLAGYGHGYTLVTPLDPSLGAPTEGCSNAGNYTQLAGFLAYFEVQK